MQYEIFYSRDPGPPEADVLEVPPALRGILRLPGLVSLTSEHNSTFSHEFGDNIAFIKPPIPADKVDEYKNFIMEQIAGVVTKNEPGATVSFGQRKKSRISEEVLAAPISLPESEKAMSGREMLKAPRKSFLDYGDHAVTKNDDELDAE